MAFAITDDREKQLQVYESLPDWRESNPAAIRQALTETDDRGGRQAGPFRRAGRLPRRRRRVAQPTCSAMRSISKTPSCCTNWPPTSSKAVRQRAGSRRLEMGGGQPRARLERHPRLRPDLPAAGGCAAGAARPENAGRKPSWKPSRDAVEDDGIGRADRRTRGSGGSEACRDRGKARILRRLRPGGDAIRRLLCLDRP